MTLEQFARFIVNVDENLFAKYKIGIVSHFSEYLQKNYPDAIDDNGQIHLDELKVGIHVLRENYMKKNSFDYSAEDSAALMLTNNELYTTEYVSANPIGDMVENHYNTSEAINHVFVKRSATTGRLIPCVNQKFVKILLEKVNSVEELKKSA